MKILIVEDDAEIASAIRDGLDEVGYYATIVRDGERAYRVAEAGDFGLIILDRMLPSMDGIQICRALREQKVTTPILMLTARDEVKERVEGLESGADDYLGKPFDFEELVARVRALIRRDKVHKAGRITIDDMEIDTVGRRVSRGGKEVDLTPREYSLLEALASRQGQVLTRDEIQERVWIDDFSTSNNVDVHIRNLRRKIDEGAASKLIHTVHGVGYSLRVEEGAP